MRDDILAFRLFHPLTYVSILTMPNELHHRLSRAFGIERMLATANRDVAEIGTYLDAVLAWRWSEGGHVEQHVEEELAVHRRHEME